MCPYQQVTAAADGVSYVLDHHLGILECLQRKLSGVEGRHGHDRIELERGETLLQVMKGSFRSQIGIAESIGYRQDVLFPGGVGCVVAARIDVGIGAEPFVYLAPEEIVDRLVEGLADDVPAGHFDAAEHAHRAQVRMLGVAAGVDDAPETLDLERFPSDDIAFHHVLDQLCDLVWMKRDSVDFSKAFNLIVCGQLQEDEIGSSVVGWRISYDVGLEIGNLHDSCSCG